MPWQRLIADVGGELVPHPLTGLLIPAYREVVVTVPRQSGKTTLILAWQIQRAVGWEASQRIVYSAQTGNDARKKLIEDQVPLLEPRKAKLGIRRILKGMGNEAVEFKNGSRIVLMASGDDAGHGKTVDLGIKDEFFADYDDRRDQALLPAMLTKPAAQILTASTMGTDASVPLNRAVDRGRQSIMDGAKTGIAYFEWSADTGADPDDPATWWSCMPALGFTQGEDAVRHARLTLTDGEFRRAMLNLPTISEERIIPGEAWDLVCSADAKPVGRVFLALDVNEDRSAAAIVAVSDAKVVELVAHQPGVGWIEDMAKRLHEAQGLPWVVDGGGPVASMVPDLRRLGLPIQTITGREFVNACGAFYDDVAERRISVRRHPSLDAAVAGATRRMVGDAWAWGRKGGSVDISPLVAATIGLAAVRNEIPAATPGFVDLDDFLEE
jgi:hypothetical protein